MLKENVDLVIIGGGIIGLATANEILRTKKNINIIVLDSLEYEKHLEGVDLVIVGEGSTDKSTQFNKSPVAVAMRAKKLGIPVICLSGSIGDGYKDSRELGITSFLALSLDQQT